MVDEMLLQLDQLYARETAFFSQPLPLREQGDVAENYLREMGKILRELGALQQEYFFKLSKKTADKEKDREFYGELSLLKELYRKRQKNLALIREKLQETGKELDRVKVEKKVFYHYHPRKKIKARFIDSKS